MIDFILLLLIAPAGADVYQCTQDNGVTSYQEDPCPGETGKQIGMNKAERETKLQIEDAQRVCEAYSSKRDKSLCYDEFGINDVQETEKPAPKYSNDQLFTYAEYSCPQVIERMASWDIEWTDGWGGLKFNHRPMAGSKPNIVTYYGDSLRMQNGFGAWSNVIYYCDIDKVAGQIVDVRIVKGKL